MAFNKLWTIAVRSLLRNRRRSLFTLIAVALGLALLMTVNGLIWGAIESSLQDTIRLQTGHLQIRKDSYEAEKLSLKWEDLLENPQALADQAMALQEVKAAAPVLWINGIINTAEDSFGLRVYGIPADSAIHDPVRQALVAGEFLAPDDRSGILIGQRLANSLGISLGQRVALDIVNADGQPVEDIFTVRGIFATGFPFYDENSVFMTLAKAQAFAGTGDRASAIVIMLRRQQDAKRVARALASPGLRVLTWEDLNALMLTAVQAGMGYYYLLDLIVMLVVAVIIANTLLMAVFERVREIGILAALGMRPGQVRLMFLLEAASLGLVGLVIGFGLGSLGVAYLAKTGLDIGEAGSVAGEAMMLGTKMYAQFMPGLFVGLGAAMLAIILLASFYPAWYASRLQPVEALHTL